MDQAQLFYPSDCSDEAPISEAAAILAMFGWQNDEPGVPSLVTCSACFRRLGLWLFQKKGEEANGEASVCRLDVVGEHRDVNSSSVDHDTVLTVTVLPVDQCSIAGRS